MLQAGKEQPKQAFDMLSLIGPSTKTVESQNTNLTIDKVPMRTETDNERIFNDFSPKPAHDSIGSSHSAFTALKPDRGPFGRLGPVSSSARITEEFPFKRLHLDPCSVNRVFPVTSVFAGIMQRRKRRENRIRRQRTTFTSEQTLKLEVEYNRSEYISRPRRYELAEILNLSESQIKIWFQNRRAKEKRIEKAHVDHQIRSCDTAAASMSPGGFPVPSSYTMFYGSCLWPYPPPTAVSELYTDASKGS